MILATGLTINELDDLSMDWPHIYAELVGLVEDQKQARDRLLGM